MRKRRNRRLGPTQEQVLEALRLKGARMDRRALETATGLSQAQVVSALRGLLQRELVSRTRSFGAHQTAAYWWAPVSQV